MNKFLLNCAICFSSTFLVSGCGTYVPQIEEVWEPVEVPFNMEARIKNRIFCDTIAAIKSTRDPKKPLMVDGKFAIPDDYGFQLQINLTAQEQTTFNPGFTFNRTYRNSTVAGVAVPNNFNLGLGVNLSSTATRTDTLYSYYKVGRVITGNEAFCKYIGAPHGSSLLLQSDLGIEPYLNGAALENTLLHSSPAAMNTKDNKESKDVKRDIYSYDVKFAVVTNGNINPTWKLVNLSANTGSMPLLAAGRTTTHELVLTFSPDKSGPTEEAIQVQFNGQIVQQLNRIEHALQ